MEFVSYGRGSRGGVGLLTLPDLGQLLSRIAQTLQRHTKQLLDLKWSCSQIFWSITVLLIILKWAQT